MQISISPSRPATADAIAFAVRKDGPQQVPLHASRTIVEGAKAARFVGEGASVFETFAEEGGKVIRVLLAGTGAGAAADYEKAGAALAAKLLTSGAASLVVEFPGVVDGECVARFALGLKLRSWRMDVYRTRLPEKQKPTLEQVTLVTDAQGAAETWNRLSALADGVQFARELVTEPANIIYPESFVERCSGLADLGIEITVLDEKQMAELGMGALLGVAQGSVRKPRLLALRWDGTGGAQKKPAVFVGKGVTFDTGGISIKPAAGMEDMKWDMGGAAAVAGVMKALAGRSAKAHVVGVCGLVENMPGGNAQRPGDIVRSMSGQTIEVINTDAEGRLVLCDAMHWAQKTFAPEIMIDLATLTGAMIISLGSEFAGVFSNDDGLADNLLAAGTAAGDPLWRFPLTEAYNKLLDSPIADMKNVGPRGAGSITAAQFLQRYVESGVKWAHLDIAGMVWADKPGANWDKGATGFGVRLLDQFVSDQLESK